MAKIDTLNISFTDRNARRRGPTSSEAWNDIHDELAVDLAGIYDQWNNRLKTLTDTLPDGTDDATVDAFANGLDGQTLYTKEDATISDTDYWNTIDSRPNTVYEQFVDLYSDIDTLETTLSNQISGQVFSATNISLSSPTTASFTATDVNAALLELYNLFTAGYITSGTGSPEGVVTANIGAIYSRTDGGASTTLYIKESGSGTANGWVAK